MGLYIFRHNGKLILWQNETTSRGKFCSNNGRENNGRGQKIPPNVPPIKVITIIIIIIMSYMKFNG